MSGCPFAFTLRLAYEGWSDALTTMATAPLERWVWTRQTGATHDTDGGGTVLSWQGAGARLWYTVLGRALSGYCNDFWFTRLKRVKNEHHDDDDKEEEEDDDVEMRRRVTAGGLAALTSVTFLYPLLYAAVRITLRGDDPATTTAGVSVRRCIRERLHAAGVTGLYRGWGTTLARVMVQHAVSWRLYRRFVVKPSTTTAADDTSSSSANDGKETTASWFRSFVTQQGMEVLAACVAYPLDTVARRRQMDVPFSSSTFRFDVLYAGISIHIVRIVGANAILAVYHSEALERFDFFRRFMMKLFH